MLLIIELDNLAAEFSEEASRSKLRSTEPFTHPLATRSTCLSFHSEEPAPQAVRALGEERHFRRGFAASLISSSAAHERLSRRPARNVRWGALEVRRVSSSTRGHVICNNSVVDSRFVCSRLSSLSSFTCRVLVGHRHRTAPSKPRAHDREECRAGASG